MTSKSSVSAPVKRLNPKGDDVLFRNAKWAPGGDLGEEPSSIVDVTMKDNGIYSILEICFTLSERRVSSSERLISAILFLILGMNYWCLIRATVR